MAALLVLLLSMLISSPAHANLVINELMYAPYEPWPSTQPFPTTNRTEYVEIYNAGTGTANLVDYRFDNGVSFNFADGATLAPGAYLVVCDHLPSFTNAYPDVTNVVGNLGGVLANGGERVTLSRREDGSWKTEDTIRYIDDPGSDNTGYSLELVNPDHSEFRNQYFGDWVTSLTVSGTPGVVNSTFDSTPAPVLGDVTHEPPFPPAGGVTRITARTAVDTNSLNQLIIQYRVSVFGGGLWSNSVMLDDGDRGDTLAGDGIYTVELPTVKDPPMQEGDIMEFRIQVSNIHGVRTFPATNRAGFLGDYSYFCKFGEDLHSDVDYAGEYQTFHILMTTGDKTLLETRDHDSDDLIDATFISSDGKIYYNCSTRYRGGTSRSDTLGGYRINLPNGKRHMDRGELNLNHVSAVDQWIGLQIFGKTLGELTLGSDLTRVFVNSQRKIPPSQGIYVLFEGVDNDLARKRYPGELGNFYWADGDGHNGYIHYDDDNPASYFNDYYIRINNPYTAWHDIIDFSKILDADATNYPSTLTNRMNVRAWARHMATQVCIDNNEAGFASPGHSNGDELRLYADDASGRFDIYPWDMDTIIGTGADLWSYGGAGAAGDLIAKFLYSDPVLPYYVGDVYDIMTTVMSHESLTNFFLEMGSAADKVPGHIATFDTQRVNLLNLINTNLTVSGYSAGSPTRTFPTVITGNVFEVQLDQALFSNEWALVGSLNFTGASSEFAEVVRPNGFGSFLIVADAIMFSNAVVGEFIVDDSDPRFSTNGTEWEVVASGGYTNGSFHLSSDNGGLGDTATWQPDLPQPGVYAVYAWMPYYPFGASQHFADYGLQSITEALSIGLTGTAPQNYTDRVTVNGMDADWDLLNNLWAMTEPVILQGNSGDIDVRAIDSEGNTLASIHMLGLAERSPQVAPTTISANTTWNSQSGTFIITNDMTISAAASLTVSPGTIVLFEPGKIITVNGALNLLGTHDHATYFAPRYDGTDWTIRLTNGASMLASNAQFHGGNIVLDGGGTLNMQYATVNGDHDPGGIISAASGEYVHLYRSTVRDYSLTRFQDTPTVIEQCLFENMTVTGIELCGSAPTATVSRTTVRMSRSASVQGIRFDAITAGLADSCLLYALSGTGVVVNAGAVSIRECLFDACNTGVASSGAASVSNVNNTIVNATHGLNNAQQVLNAIIWYIDSSSVAGTPANVTYSDIELPGTNVHTGTGNINRNPWFKNPADSDYRLLPISPALGSGLAGLDMGACFPVGANPAAPTALTLQAETNRIYVAWNDNSSDEESGFEIERSSDENNWLSVGTVGANVTNYWDEGLTQNTLYSYRVRAFHARGRSLYSDAASALTEFQDLTQLLIDNLRFTEIMYDLPGSDDAEFLELKNISLTETLDLSDLYFDNGLTFIFPLGTMLAPQQFFVLARNAAAFSNNYPAVQVDGVFQSGSLANGGERLEIEAADGTTVLDATYRDGDSPDWYPTTSKLGYSLVPVIPNPIDGDPDQPVFWRASTFERGSPGADDPNPGFGTIVINEVLAHQDLDDPGDWVELCNVGTNPVDVSGWFLSDSSADLKKYTIPDAPQSIIPGNGYLVLTEADHFGTNVFGTNGFAFSELGDEIILSSGLNGTQTSFRTSVDFGATERNVTLGRHPLSDGSTDFTAMTTPTMGAPNAAPLVGPIVINEIMYNPAAGGKEFVELLNISTSEVPLYDVLNPSNTWEFDGAFEFTFPTNVSLATGERILIVSIEPGDFEQIFGLSNAAFRIFGPFSGALNNGGDSVKLYFPGQPEPDGFVPRIRTDRVKYDDRLPWPPQADNDGPSLEKRGPALYGNDPTNWFAASIGGTPGVSNNTSGLPSVGFAEVDSDAIETDAIIEIEVTLLPSITSPVIVEYAVTGGTASPGSDFILDAGTLIFWAYDSTKIIPLTIINDSSPAGEIDETVEITLSTVTSNAFFGGNRVHTHTITDNDATTLPAPLIMPSTDTSFTNTILVTFSNIQDSIVYYTLNGHLPTRDDIFYNGPFVLTHSARVTARTFMGAVNAGAWTNVLLTEDPKPVLFVIVDEPNASTAPVVAASDDAWQEASGVMHITGPSIELGSFQIGILPNHGAAFRFLSVPIPQGANVTNAYVQFTAANADSEAASYQVYAEATNVTATLTTNKFDISGSPLTTASTLWNPPTWNTSQRGSAQRTPDISAVINEIVSRPDWVSGNSLTIVIRYLNTGSRWVRTFQSAPDQVAALRAEWEGEEIQIPMILGVITDAPNSFTILWESDPVNTYSVYRSTNLMHDFPGDILTNAFAGDPLGTNIYTDTNAVPPAAFYTIGVDTE